MAKKKDRDGLSSAKHATVDPAAFYADILDYIPTDGTIIDAGGGSGRDAVFIKKRGGDNLRVYNIDPDPVRYLDSQDLYTGQIEQALSATETRKIHEDGKVIHVEDDILMLDNFNEVSENAQGDFVLCNAVMMFLPLHEHQKALTNLFNLTAPGGNTIVRYRTENLKSDMVKIDNGTLMEQAQNAGFVVNWTKPVPDPLGRDHVWHQMILHKPK